MSQADSSLSTNVLPFRPRQRQVAQATPVDANTLLLAACLQHMTKKSVGRVRQALCVHSDAARDDAERQAIVLKALDLIAEHC